MSPRRRIAEFNQAMGFRFVGSLLSMISCLIIQESASSQVSHWGIEEIWQLEAPDQELHLGHSISSLGDIDGDGTNDLVVGAPADGSRQLPAVFLVSGASGAILRRIDGAMKTEQFGLSVSGLGDINLDGYPDFLVGAPYFNAMYGEEGRAIVYSGVDGSVLYELQGSTGSERFGFSVDGLGDADGDAIPDFIVGAPWADPVLFDEGSAIIYSGKTGAVLKRIDGDGYLDNLGFCVAGLGDVDGDGLGDAVVGVPYHNPSGSGTNAGAAFVYSVPRSGAIYSFYGEVRDDYFGFVVDGAQDFNADGTPDIAVGAPGYNSSTTSSAGRAYVFSGVDGKEIFGMTGPDWTSDFAKRVAGVGDTNHDGFDDLLIGDPNSLYIRGHASLISGRTDSVLAEFFGESAVPRPDLLGWGLSGAGDLDGDGIDDLVIASMWHYVDSIPHAGLVTAFSLASGHSAPLRLDGIQPDRSRFDREQPVVLNGKNFRSSNRVSVRLGGESASDIQVIDHQTLTCTAPKGAPGLTDIVLQVGDQVAVLTQGFRYTPALLATGDLRPGGLVDVVVLCDPGDSIVCLVGFPPPVSIPTPPFSGELCIVPFHLLFFVNAAPSDQWVVSYSIPADPALSGVEFLLQSLVGLLSGDPREGAWTNCALLKIE